MKKDKALHLIAGFVIYIISMILFEDSILSFLMSVVAGGLKEMWDMKGYGKVELKDFLYTAVGGILGVTVWNTILHLI